MDIRAFQVFIIMLSLISVDYIRGYVLLQHLIDIVTFLPTNIIHIPQCASIIVYLCPLGRK